MANVFTDEFNVVVTRVADNSVTVTPPSDNTVVVQETGTPVIIGAGVGIFTNRITYYSTDYKVAVKGFGEYTTDSDFKPIFIFENSIQKTEIDGYVHITGSASHDPLSVSDSSLDNIFKISSDELPIFKMHTTYKAPIVGGLFFYDGDLYYGTE